MVLNHLLAHPLRLTISTLKLACAFHLCVTHVAQVAPSMGPSMVPTFAVDGEWLYADMTRRRGRGVGVGDLVLYRIPIFADQDGVKRVVGMPGDYVSLGTPGEKGEEKMIQVCSVPSLAACRSNRSRQDVKTWAVLCD